MADFQELQDFQPILKYVYLPVRKNAFPKMHPLTANAKRGSKKVRFQGGDLLFDVKLGKRGGFISSAKGFTPEATLAAERQGRLRVARTYAVVQIDGLADAATKDAKASFIGAARKMTEDVMDQWQIEQTRILHGDSLGVRALVLSRTSSTVVTAASPYGIASSGPGGLHLEVGDTVASLDDNASDALLGKAKISTITHSGDTATITFASSIEGSGTIAAADKLVTAVPTATDTNDTSFGAEPFGIKALVDVEAAFATWEGINHARWVAQKLTATSVDEVVVMKLLNLIRGRAGINWRTNPKAMLLLTTTGIWQQYGDSLLGLRRFTAPEMTLNGGFTGVQVAGATLLDDPWAPRGRLYAIHTPDTVFVDLMDFGIRTFNDSPKWKQASNRDAFEALYAVYWNYGAFMRSSHGVISGITDTVNYSPVF